MFSALLFQAATLVHAATPGAAIVDDAEILEIEGDFLTLAHLATPGDIPAGVGGDFRLLKAPEGARSIILTPDDQKRLLSRRLPTFRIAPRSPRPVRVIFSPRSLDDRKPPCFILDRPVAAGEPFDRGWASIVGCDPAKARARLTYDRGFGAPVTFAALSAGAYLGPVLLPEKLPQRRGSAMTLRTRLGPVTIDRAATLVQPGHAGRKAFAQLSDGRIIAARLPVDHGDGDDAN